MNELTELLQSIRPEIDFTQSNLAENGVLDSMDIMLIVDGISQHYNIQINPLDIVPEYFDSVSAMYELLQKYINH